MSLETLTLHILPHVIPSQFNHISIDQKQPDASRMNVKTINISEKKPLTDFKDHPILISNLNCEETARKHANRSPLIITTPSAFSKKMWSKNIGDTSILNMGGCAILSDLDAGDSASSSSSQSQKLSYGLVSIPDLKNELSQDAQFFIDPNNREKYLKHMIALIILQFHLALIHGHNPIIIDCIAFTQLGHRGDDLAAIINQVAKLPAFVQIKVRYSRPTDDSTTYLSPLSSKITEVEECISSLRNEIKDPFLGIEAISQYLIISDSQYQSLIKTEPAKLSPFIQKVTDRSNLIDPYNVDKFLHALEGLRTPFPTIQYTLSKLKPFQIAQLDSKFKGRKKTDPFGNQYQEQLFLHITQFLNHHPEVLAKEQLRKFQKTITEDRKDDWIVNNKWRKWNKIIHPKNDPTKVQFVPTHVQRMNHQITMMQKGQQTCEQAVWEIVRLAVKAHQNFLWFRNRDDNSTQFYSNILTLLDIDIDATLNKMENYILARSGSKEKIKEWWDTYGELPTTVGKILHKIQHPDPAAKLTKEERLFDILSVAVAQAESLSIIRSNYAQFFYSNITSFICLKKPAHNNAPIQQPVQQPVQQLGIVAS